MKYLLLGVSLFVLAGLSMPRFHYDTKVVPWQIAARAASMSTNQQEFNGNVYLLMHHNK